MQSTIEQTLYFDDCRYQKVLMTVLIVLHKKGIEVWDKNFASDNTIFE